MIAPTVIVKQRKAAPALAYVDRIDALESLAAVMQERRLSGHAVPTEVAKVLDRLFPPG